MPTPWSGSYGETGTTILSVFHWILSTIYGHMFYQVVLVCDKTLQEGSTVKQQFLILFNNSAGNFGGAPMRAFPATLGSASLIISGIISGNNPIVCLAMPVNEWSAMIISHIYWVTWFMLAGMSGMNWPLGLSWSRQPMLLHITLKVLPALKHGQIPQDKHFQVGLLQVCSCQTGWSDLSGKGQRQGQGDRHTSQLLAVYYLKDLWPALILMRKKLKFQQVIPCKAVVLKMTFVFLVSLHWVSSPQNHFFPFCCYTVFSSLFATDLLHCSCASFHCFPEIFFFSCRPSLEHSYLGSTVFAQSKKS